MSTGATTLAIPRSQVTSPSRLRDFVELAKPRITILELVTAVAGMYLATHAQWSPLVVGATLLGAGLLAASANSLNMYLERRLDAKMTRTADRPLPAGRMAPAEAAVFGVATVSIGFTLLVLGVNWTTALLGLASWFLYVAVYTPLKTRTPLNTFVGAISGALPIVMGWTAGGGALDATALGLFLVLFLWQYPHFMAIAWLCKDDYAAAGYKMDTVVEPTGARAGALAVAGAALLLPAALLPAIRTDYSAQNYAVLASLFTLAFVAAAAAFLVRRNDRSARLLLRASLLYLPAWMVVLCLFGS